MSVDHLRRAALLSAALIMSALAFWAVTQNYFIADDFFNFYLIRTEPIASVLFKPWFGHMFAFRNVFFLLLFKTFGMQPTGYFYFILLTHLLNVALLFRVIRFQTGRSGLACFGATLWGISPLHAETLGWLSVYGHCLNATLLLAVCSQIARLAATGAEIPPTAPALWVVALLCGATSYAVGVALAMISPIMLLLMMPPGSVRRPHVYLFIGLAIFTPVLWWVCNTWMTAPDPMRWSKLAAGRGASDLLVATLRTTYELFIAGLWGLLTGTVASPQQAISGAAAVLALAAGLVLVVVILGARSATQRTALAWALVALASYGIIATGRTPLWMTIAPNLAVVFPRYQYVATIALTAILCLALGELGSRLDLSRRQRDSILVCSITACAAWLWFSPRPIDHHAAERATVLGAVEQMRSQIAHAPPSHDVYIENRKIRLGETPSDWYAGTFVVFFDHNVVDGRRIYFVATPEMYQAALEEPESRLASLLVPPDGAPPSTAQPPRVTGGAASADRRE